MKLQFDSSGIIGRFFAEGLLQQELDVVIEALTTELTGRVEEAYIFGSHARTQSNAQSDLDLILIKQTPKKFHQRAEEFEDLYDSISPDLDILVYTPEEFATCLQEPTTGFWAEVKRDRLRVI